MATEIFTRHDFEAALPCHCRTHTPLWQHQGLIDGEHAYHVTPFPQHPTLAQYAVSVRSSVHADGRAAGTGEDSIRAWIIVAETGQPFGSKISHHVTRVPGWQTRLTETLRRLAGIIRQIAPCPCCGQPCPVFKAGKNTNNPGRLFAKCTNRECRRPHFAWLAQ
jgi:hypothetical protein